LGAGLRDIKLPDQLYEAVWNALPDDIVVHGAQLVAYSGLNFGVKAALLLYFLHVLSHASAVAKFLYFHG
jgi:hypothetical protein